MHVSTIRTSQAPRHPAGEALVRCVERAWIRFFGSDRPV